jgi:5'-deoxynucleotidase YfbR-like HD superfamily hydrolase
MPLGGDLDVCEVGRVAVFHDAAESVGGEGVAEFPEGVAR